MYHYVSVVYFRCDFCAAKPFNSFCDSLVRMLVELTFLNSVCLLLFFFFQFVDWIL